MAVWCVARLRPMKRRLTRVQQEFRSVRWRGGVKLIPMPRTGLPRFTQQVILERMGFEVYMPAKFEWRIVNRYTKEKEQLPAQRLPGWAFIGAEGAPRWDLLKDSGAIAFFGMVDGSPLILSDAEMMRIRNRFGDVTKPEVERFMRSHCEFSEGDVVILPGGPFDGIKFDVREIRGEITRVVGDILGARRDIEVSTWDLRKLG